MGRNGLICLLMAHLVFHYLALPAAAGEVFGMVSLAEGSFPPGGIFNVAKGNIRIAVQTREDGKYSIFLAPGRYRVGVLWDGLA